MRNNYKKKNQRETGGGKRIGKSLERKLSGTSKRTASGRFEREENTRGSSRYAKPGKYKTNEKEESFKPKREASKSYSKHKGSVKKTTDAPVASTGDMRLNRFVANAGVCSRREADKFILAGAVTINGKIINELGVRVKSGDEVRFDGRKLNAEKKIYILLNKPKNFVTTTDDPHAERTVMELVKSACEERIYPVGRLDRNTTGLLLFTNDGDLSKKLTHPSYLKKKVYQVSLDKQVSKNHILEIADGIELEDGRIAADSVSYISNEDKTEVGIEIHSGKNRIVRRIFEHFGYNVKKLDRVFFAGLTKKNLPRGKWRFLSEKEVQFLKMN